MRVRWPLLGMLTVVALLVAAVVLSALHRPAKRDPATDPANVAAAQQLITGLPAPSGATRDLQVGACGQPVQLLANCITDPSVSPDTLLGRVVAQLQARGSVLSAESCDSPSGPDTTYICRAQLSYSDVGISVISSGTEAADQSDPTRLLIRMASS